MMSIVFTANLQGAEFYLVSITGADFDAATRLPITDWQELIKGHQKK
jgi:hypothetical protein